MIYVIETLVTDSNRLAISLGHLTAEGWWHDGIRCVSAPLGSGHAIVLAAFLERLREWLPNAPRLTAAHLIGAPFAVDSAS